jgi:hypothetical protein
MTLYLAQNTSPSAFYNALKRKTPRADVATERDTSSFAVATDAYAGSGVEQLKHLLGRFNSGFGGQFFLSGTECAPPVCDLRHECTGACHFYESNGLYVCRASGSVHRCGRSYCDRSVATNCGYVCELTGILQADKYDNCDESNPVDDECTREVDREFGVQRASAPITHKQALPAGLSKAVQKLLSHPTKNEGSRAAAVAAASSASPACDHPSGGKPSSTGSCAPPSPSGPPVVKHREKRKLKARTLVFTPALLAKLRSQAASVVRRVFSSKAKKPRVGARHVMEPPARDAISNEQVVYIVEVCIELYKNAHASPVYPEFMGGYKFEYHVLTVIFEMRKGFSCCFNPLDPTSSDHWVVPQAGFILRCLPSQTDVFSASNNSPWKSRTLTDTQKTFRIIQRAYQHRARLPFDSVAKKVAQPRPQHDVPR